MRLEQETAVHKDVTIGNRIDEAETKATHYMTDTTNGVKVHPDNDTANYVLIQDGVEIYRENERVASYKDVVRIGKDDNGHVDIDDSKLEISGYDGDPVSVIGSLNDAETGLAELVYEDTILLQDNETIEGVTYWGKHINHSVASIVACKQNGQTVDINDVHLEGINFVYSSLFSNGDSIEVTYTTSDIVPIFIFGQDSTASASSSVAMGRGAEANDEGAMALGHGATANGYASFAEGSGTEANGHASHAEGDSTIANEDYSHTEGLYTQANGFSSHAQNSYTIANGDNQTALGKYNIADTVSAIILGNGNTDNNRSNALTVDWNGNVQCGTVNGINLASLLNTETITDWDTTYNENKKIRFFYAATGSSNAPVSGNNYWAGFEIGPVSWYRVQVAFQVNVTPNNVYVRHFKPNDNWVAWSKFTVT